MTTIDVKKAEQVLRAHAMAKPETREDHPWGHSAFKVKGKAFLFLSGDAGQFNVTVKLPRSNVTALDQPFAEPTGYGLGKSGWVSAQFAAGDRVPIELMKAWVDESFGAIAPKRVLAQLDAGGSLGVRALARAKAPRAKGAKSRAPVRSKPRAKPATKRPPPRTVRARPRSKSAARKPSA